LKLSGGRFFLQDFDLKIRRKTEIKKFEETGLNYVPSGALSTTLLFFLEKSFNHILILMKENLIKIFANLKNKHFYQVCRIWFKS
jgi:hypothetical protein